jgi:hypothetical protein
MQLAMTWRQITMNITTVEESEYGDHDEAMQNKQDITVLKESFRSCRDAMNRISMRGLKARRSLARGKALWHRNLSTPEAPSGRNLFVRIAPFSSPSVADRWFRAWRLTGIYFAGRFPALLIMPLQGIRFCILHFIERFPALLIIRLSALSHAKISYEL